MRASKQIVPESISDNIVIFARTSKHLEAIMRGLSVRIRNRKVLQNLKEIKPNRVL